MNAQKCQKFDNWKYEHSILMDLHYKDRPILYLRMRSPKFVARYFESNFSHVLSIRDSEMVFFVDLEFFRRRTVGLFDNLKYLSGRRLPDMCVCEV